MIISIPFNLSIYGPDMKTTAPAPLPTPRQMLTSIINSISSIPLSEPDGDNNGEPASSSSLSASSSSPDPNSNNPEAAQHAAKPAAPIISSRSGVLPHRRMSSYRPLLTALHALFPASLLAALDLLDRGLVSRFEMRNEHDEPSAVYHVHSATTTATYTVRLAAWSCPCAEFAFSAFSGSDVRDPRDLGAGDGGLDDGGCWEFGGLSIDGRRAQYRNGDGNGGGAGDAGLVEVQGVPCCKHLLACLLADRWPVARRCVMEKHVSREELVGIMAGI